MLRSCCCRKSWNSSTGTFRRTRYIGSNYFINRSISEEDRQKRRYGPFPCHHHIGTTSVTRINSVSGKDINARRYFFTFGNTGDSQEDIENDNDDETTKTTSYQPWKTLLEIPARASWRVTDPEPNVDLEYAYEQILQNSGRTSKQLKRAHRKVLDIHTNLEEIRERERRHLVNGKKSHRQQSNKKQKQNDGDVHPVYYGYEQTLASLKHRLHPNYAITKRVLEECQSLIGHDGWQPKRIIDFGIGCGSASAAAIDVFDDQIEWIHGIDPSQPMRECAQKLIEGMTRHRTKTPPRMTFSNGFSEGSLSDGGGGGGGSSSSNGDENNIGAGTGTGSGRFDVALFAYAATELPDISSALAAAAILFDKLKPNGIFVMIEPGTPDGFNSVRTVRNMLLDCCPPDDADFEWKERCHAIAPCTHNGPCPMVRHKKNFQPKGKLGHDIPQVLANENDDTYTMDDTVHEMEHDGDNDHDDEIEGDDDVDDVDDVDDHDDWNDDNDDDDDNDDTIDLSSHHGLSEETDAFNSSFCSFVHTMPGSSEQWQKRGEKFSYLVVQKKLFVQNDNKNNESENDIDNDEWKNDPFKYDNVTEILAKAFDAEGTGNEKEARDIYEKVCDLETRYVHSDEDSLGLELLRGTNKRQNMGRIIRAPIKKKGHVYIDYCSKPGRIIRTRITKSTSNYIAPGIYAAARKSRWGGYWPDTMDKIFSSSKKK